MKRVLVIDDEANLQRSLALFLGEKGFEVACAGTAAEGLSTLASFRPRVVILDLRLPDASGLDVLAPIAEAAPQARVIVVTAYHDMETTIEAMRRGAFDYLHKPLDIDELERAVARAAHVPQAEAPAAPAPSADPATRLVGSSRAMRQIFKTIGLMTSNRATVLIEGETGTGKEVIARVIHERSPDRDQPFITIDCTTLVDGLMESELFGHERGAFTGAASAKQGRLEAAGRGTLFFDEVGELSLAMQAKLLRFLERREYSRVGGVDTLHSQARIIGATNRSLEEMAAGGDFRQDLYYRLKVTRVQVPPLRERLADLEEMVPHFLGRIAAELQVPVEGIEEGAMAILKAYAWPGNVRELINVLTGAVIDSRGPILRGDSLRAALARSQHRTGAAPGVLSLAEAERRHILAALGQTRWNITAAARVLEISRPTLRGRMTKHGITRPESGEGSAQRVERFQP